MKKSLTRKILKYIGYILLLSLTIFLFKVLVPRTYNVRQIQKRENIHYWDLSTGSKIAYSVTSSKTEKKPYPIIYLHGGPSVPVSKRYINLLSQLSEDGYDIYFYDQVGCGESNTLDNIEEYTAERHKKDLEEIVKIIGAEKVIIIGQSWGPMLATLFVADNPEKVEKLIFTGPGPIIPVKNELANLPAPDSLHLKAPIFSHDDANIVTRNIRSQIVMFWAKKFGQRLASDKEANDFLLTLIDQTNKSLVCDTTNAPKAETNAGYYAQIMTIHSFHKIQDPRPKLKNSDIPLLLLKGQCDHQKWGFITEYLELFPKHELVIIPNAGHGIPIEQPEFFLKTIRNFLNH